MIYLLWKNRLENVFPVSDSHAVKWRTSFARVLFFFL